MALRDDVDREIERYNGLEGLVLLVPEERWAEVRSFDGVRPGEAEDEVIYRGARLHPGAVTAVVAQEGF